MNYRQLFFILLLTQCSVTNFAQSYGGPGADSGNHFVSTSDGGYILCGMNENQDLYFIKTDDLGNTQWSKVIGDTGLYESANAIAQTVDGGYIAMCTQEDPTGAYRNLSWLIRFNTAGDTLWSRHYFYGVWSNVGASVQIRPNGNYLIGINASAGAGNYENLLVETDTFGLAFWNVIVSGCGVNNIYQTDSLIYSCGTTINIPEDMSISAINDTGDLKYFRVYTDTSSSLLDISAQGICGTTDGNLMVCGNTNFFTGGANREFLIMKSDMNGDSIWIRHFSISLDDRLFAVRALSDGGFIFGGSTLSNGNNQFILIRTNSLGDTLWTRIYAAPMRAEMRYMDLNNYGGFTAIGDTTVNGQPDIWLLITDSAGNVLRSGPTGIPRNEINSADFTVNKFADQLAINFTNWGERKNAILSIYNEQGQLLEKNSFKGILSEQTIFLPFHQTHGMYFINIQNSDISKTKRFIF